jgi:hypothetical protein
MGSCLTCQSVNVGKGRGPPQKDQLKQGNALEEGAGNQ